MIIDRQVWLDNLKDNYLTENLNSIGTSPNFTSEQSIATSSQSRIEDINSFAHLIKAHYF
jgi:hypothetical protein